MTDRPEVDLVIEWRGRLMPIEVKSTKRPKGADCAGLRLFMNEYPGVSGPALLLHAGDEIGWIADDVLAAPWWSVLRSPKV